MRTGGKSAIGVGVSSVGQRMSMAGLGLDRNSDLSLYQQVATHLRNLILDGRLPAGARLLGSRRPVSYTHLTLPTSDLV